MDEQMKKYSIFIHIQYIYIQYTHTHMMDYHSAMRKKEISLL